MSTHRKALHISSLSQRDRGKVACLDSIMCKHKRPEPMTLNLTHTYVRTYTQVYISYQLAAYKTHTEQPRGAPTGNCE